MRPPATGARGDTRRRSRCGLLGITSGLVTALAACGGADSTAEASAAVGDLTTIDAKAMARLTAGSADYCAIPDHDVEILALRPSTTEAPVDDVNWFARPVPHDGEEWLVAFASHDQNYLYDLSNGRRIAIPDRSDAVATPDGRYMTVPSYYTPDSTVRFYPVEPMLDALDRGEDVADLEPAFVQDHPALERVYYQSTALVSESAADGRVETTYRLMFSGTNHESRFRIADYVFSHDAADGRLLGVTPSPPMAICPAVQNDLNTPFISKDGRYVAAYTSETAGNEYSSGSSLKIFEITSVDPGAGTTTCEAVVDLGFAAGKADFSFDGSMLTFHLSQGAYLTPFVNGGLPAGTITDIVVARFERDDSGRIIGHSGLQRLSTSLESGVGSYFPAFFPDGNLFYISNRVPRGSEEMKRFDFRVVDPSSRGWRPPPTTEGEMALWAELGELWQLACVPQLPEGAPVEEHPFPLGAHELPLHALSLSVPQCTSLVEDARNDEGAGDRDWGALMGACEAVAQKR